MRDAAAGIRSSPPAATADTTDRVYQFARLSWSSGNDRAGIAEIDVADHHSALFQRSRCPGPTALPSGASRASSPPFPQGPSLWASPPGNDGDTGPIFQGPNFAQRSQPPLIPPAQPAGSDQPLPINLATALYLSSASATGDRLRRSQRGRSRCPTSKRQSPLAAGPQCRHRLLPSRRHRPVHRRHDHPRRQARLCGGRRSDPQLRRDRRHFQAAGCPSGIGGPAVGRADRTERCLVGGGLGLFRRAAGPRQPGRHAGCRKQGRSAGPQDLGTCPRTGRGNRGGSRQGAVVRLAAGSHRGAGQLAHYQQPPYPGPSPEPRGGGRSDGAAASPRSP